ncbi:MAG: anhydro-N-acetylmuramic acid kinase [Oceanospirillaceae bacterium]|nr:anhydro-N-acetylmuramic acid kinase [Oceanospirillaceae bacterium]
MNTLPAKQLTPKSNRRIYLGVMSGTSLDGIDIVAVSFEPDFKMLSSASYDIPSDIKDLILALCLPGDNEIEKMGHLDVALAQLYAKYCNQLIDDNTNIFSRCDVCAIGLHGQTIRHRPLNDPLHNFSLQIGDANTVAELTGITTIADFRRRDLAAGGQGAPLVPAFHQSLFSHISNDRVIVNIGGMANITLLAKDNTQPLIGFDTGPGNVLLDAWINKCQEKAYDLGGAWAHTGTVNKPLLKQLLTLPYFQQDYPKSTGREQFNLSWLQQQLSEYTGLSDVDIQCTLVELTAITICDQVSRQAFSMAQLFVCGGGAKNSFLMERLDALLPDAAIVTSTKALNLAPDWVEASAFAWLAKQTLAGLNGNCMTVTGAKGERVLGAIYQP